LKDEAKEGQKEEKVRLDAEKKSHLDRRGAQSATNDACIAAKDTSLSAKGKANHHRTVERVGRSRDADARKLEE